MGVMIQHVSLIQLTTMSVVAVLSAHALNPSQTTAGNKAIGMDNATNSKTKASTRKLAILDNAAKSWTKGKSNRRESKAAAYIAALDVDEHQDNTDECVLNLTTPTVNKFRHLVYYQEITYAYLNLIPEMGSNISLVDSKHVVGINTWVWTFYGKEGSLEFLKWPIEFGIWSLGLLYNSVIIDPLNITLVRRHGTCSHLKVGNRTDDKVISNALQYLALEMMSFDKEKYGPSFFCYKQRVYIESDYVYTLCKHIVCPIVALKYSCCSLFFNKTLGKREISCSRENSFEYDLMWWVIPSIVSVLLFAYSPVLLMFVAFKCTQKPKGSEITITSQHLRNVVATSVENDAAENVGEQNTDRKHQVEEHVILMSGHHHVTLANTLCSPFKACIGACAVNSQSCCGHFLRRIFRIIFPLVSMSVVALQILLDYSFLHGFVLESMRKGVPMGFRSMIAGYVKSKDNFLPYLGGPFVAVGCYLLVTCLLLIIPKSPVELMTSCLSRVHNTDEASPLRLSLRTIGTFGSVGLVNRNGFSLLYHLFLAQFYMLLNIRFWKHSVSIQIERWSSLAPYKIRLIFLPFYIIFCFLEIVLCICLYGLPIISFGGMVIRAYITPLTRIQTRGIVLKFLCMCLGICLIVAVVFFLVMFCTIFLDATLFVTRIFIFTFTGIIVYPKTAYGYLIFGFTVFYYLLDSFGDFSSAYKQLFKETTRVAESIQRANDDEQQKLVFKINGEKGIRKSLYEFVIEVHRPRRKQVFLSFLKFAIVLTLLWMLIHLLITTDNFRELHVIMHVGTALFICALPQIAKTVCRSKKNQRQTKRFQKKLADTIRQYMGYFVEDERGGVESD